jgi:hypothetical protein
MIQFSELQSKYVAILKGEEIKGAIAVTHKWKSCKLIITETRLICIKDDVNGVESLFKLQLNQIEATTCNAMGFSVKYPRSPQLTFSFTGINAAKNQQFARSLPNMQSPSELSAKQCFKVLGVGAAVIATIAIANILNPASYGYKTLSSATFLKDCEAQLKSELPDAKVVYTWMGEERSDRTDGTYTPAFVQFSSPQVSSFNFVCVPNPDWSVKRSGTQVMGR